MTDPILSIISNVGLGGGIAVASYFAYKIALLWYGRKNGIDRQVNDLDKKVNNDHSHSIRDIWSAIDGIRNDVTDVKQDVAFIKGRMNGRKKNE